MKPTFWLFFGVLAACTVQVVGCGSKFTSCNATRTCPRGGGAGLAEAGALSDAGESVGGNSGTSSGGSGDEAAGSSGEDYAGSSGDAGAGPCGGADLDSDPKNCGTCDNDCTSSPNPQRSPQGSVET